MHATLNVKIKNADEFCELTKEFTKKAHELNKLAHELNTFAFELDFESVNAD